MRRVLTLFRLVEATLLSSAILAIAAVTILNVFARNLLNSNVAAAEELNQFLTVVVCFVGLSHAVGNGRHIRMTALFDQLDDRRRKAVMVMIAATTSVLMFAFAWYALSYTRDWVGNRVSPVLGIPLRYVYLAAPVGFALAGLQYLLAVVRNLISPGVWLSWVQSEEYLEPDEEIGA